MPVTESFLSAPLSHYDIILGEVWLRHHQGIIDYAHDQLWQLLPSGPVPLNFDILPPVETRTHLVRPLGHESEPYHRERNLAAMSSKCSSVIRLTISAPYTGLRVMPVIPPRNSLAVGGVATCTVASPQSERRGVLDTSRLASAIRI